MFAKHLTMHGTAPTTRYIQLKMSTGLRLRDPGVAPFQLFHSMMRMHNRVKLEHLKHLPKCMLYANM